MPDVLDAVIAEWTTAQQAQSAVDMSTQLRVDGKTVHSAVHEDGDQLHLLSALVGAPQSGAASVIAV
ncbi:hypothetical protein ACWDV4_06590 [Micromonospora sp. NPDC003197]